MGFDAPHGPPIVPPSFIANRAEALAAIAAKAAALGQGFTGPEEGVLQIVPGSVSGEAFRQRYAQCTIYWGKGRGTQEIHGAIRDKFDRRLPGSDANVASVGLIILGPPTTDELSCADGIGRFNHFMKNGSIFWHPDIGAHRVSGGIREVWRGGGAEQGHLRYPIGDQSEQRGDVPVESCLFMDGALFSQAELADDAIEVHVPANDLLTIIWRFFNEELSKSPDNIALRPKRSFNGVTGFIANPEQGAPNRHFAVTLNGFHDGGLLPDQDWAAHLTLRFFNKGHKSSSALQPINGQDLFFALVGIAVSASGIGGGPVEEDVTDGITAAFREPRRFAIPTNGQTGQAAPQNPTFPRESHFIGTLVHPDGHLGLYFCNTENGRPAAFQTRKIFDAMLG